MKSYKIRKNKNIFNLKSQKGEVAILLTFFIMIFIVAIILGLTSIILKEKKMIEEMDNSILAFYAADTGIENALYNIRKEGGTGEIFSTDFRDGEYKVGIEKEIPWDESFDSSSGSNNYSKVLGAYKEVFYAGIDNNLFYCEDTNKDNICQNEEWFEIGNLVSDGSLTSMVVDERNDVFYVSGGDPSVPAGPPHARACKDEDDSGICEFGEWVSSPAGQLNGESAITAMAFYKENLYAGLAPTGEVWLCRHPGAAGDVDICDANSEWNSSLSPAPVGVNIIYSLFVYKERLYVGGGGGAAKIVICEDSNDDGCEGEWQSANNAFAEQDIRSFGQYNGKLYAGTGNNAHIYACASDTDNDGCRGAEWEDTFNLSAEQAVNSLFEHKGSFYAATGDNGNLYVCRDPGIDGICKNADDEWELLYDFEAKFGVGVSGLYDLDEYKGLLYIGTGDEGRIFKANYSKFLKSQGNYKKTNRAVQIEAE